MSQDLGGIELQGLLDVAMQPVEELRHRNLSLALMIGQIARLYDASMNAQRLQKPRLLESFSFLVICMSSV